MDTMAEDDEQGGADADEGPTRVLGAGVPLLALDLEAQPASIAPLRHHLIAFAIAHGAGSAVCGDIAIAVTEAVGNAIQHAYPGREPGRISVLADVDEGALEVVVCDDGCGFRTAADDDGPAGFGLGLGLIDAVTSSCDIADSAGRGTEVWMRFALRRSA